MNITCIVLIVAVLIVGLSAYTSIGNNKRELK